MITIFQKNEQGAFTAYGNLPENFLASTAWIDLYNPTPEEEKLIEATLKIEIPTREEVWKNQVLNRFYEEDGVYYMIAALITKVDTPYPLTSAVTFILAKNYLVTIRYIAPTSFQSFSQRIVRRAARFCTGADILEGLLEEIITRVAHNSEVVVESLDKLSHDIFASDAFEASRKNPSQMMKDILKKLGGCGDLNSKINESLHSVSRLLSFFRKVPENSPEINEAVGILMTDVQALTQQTDFLSNKITFQLDATLGMINVEQNMIMKIFSIVAVFFMPPTLISSIYGMNFVDIPELHWVGGYPMALGMMTACAVGPFIYFRKKGWL